MSKNLFLLFAIITFAFCAKPAPKVAENVHFIASNKNLSLETRLAKYPFSESVKIELVALKVAEFADIEEKKARDSMGCACKSVFPYPLKDIITKKTVLNSRQIDTLTAILFKTDNVRIGKSKGLTQIKNALFFYDKNEKLFARLYIDTHTTEVWSFYKGKKEIDFVRPLLGQKDDLSNFIRSILK
jgi:hypothetical protein